MNARSASQILQTSNAERRKRLGQYFTGTGLGRLLAALAQAEKAKTIIDPMVGSGDLLAACIEIGAKPETMAGVEIDGLALDACQIRLPGASCVLGNAFDAKVISRLPISEWDLVIANPPYVRYQSFSEKSNATHSLPTAMQIRTGLLESLPRLTALDDEDKRIFATLISGYSGLADLAVPAWILCAALVKEGGRLALVVPEAWLSRDYATVIHYLLFRWFDIEFVVEDEHASWFESAQVKATLIIAKRVKRRNSVLSRPEGVTYCHISISAAAANIESPIGRLSLPGKTTEKNFAKLARQWLRHATRYSDGLTRTRPVSLKMACANAIAAASRQKWFSLVGENENLGSANIYIPHELHDWLSSHNISAAFTTFQSQGIEVGQGLRTGANDFFYADGERIGKDVLLTFSGALSSLTAKTESNIAQPVYRRQSDLPDSLTVSSVTARGYVLDLREYALPEDIVAGGKASKLYKPMPKKIAAVVRAAALANFGTLERPKKVFELTAVSTNIRTASRGAGSRHWYMLPDFSSRHRPDVFIARVNSGTPTAYLNKNRECLVDANFSTMWTEATSKWSPNALLAFMSSSWVQAAMELSGSVMGGGALKIEATHLRRLPIPNLSTNQLRVLNKLGVSLAKYKNIDKVVTEIDAVIASSLGCDSQGTMELRCIALAGKARRAKHDKNKGR